MYVESSEWKSLVCRGKPFVLFDKFLCDHVFRFVHDMKPYEITMVTRVFIYWVDL